MHRSLQIPEILDAIISKIYEPPSADELLDYWDDDYSLGVRVSLARLARTCRTFRDPALDVLWSFLKSFDPLIRCLPQDLWMHDDDGFLEFTRPLRASDWVIFQRYAQRVRVFGDDHGLALFESVPYDLVDALSSFLSDGSCFLPNLRRLNWRYPQDDTDHPSDADYSPLLPFFLSPCLTGISVGLGRFASVPSASVLSVASPLIKRFECDETSEKLMQNISENISKWRYLEYVEAGALSQKAITHLCSLRSLKYLGVRLDQLYHRSYANFPPTLESFTIFAPPDSLAACQQYLEGIHLAASHLSVIAPAEIIPTESSFEQFFAFLPSRFSTSNLRILELPIVSCAPDDDPSVVWSLETIKPLFAFTNMTVFRSHIFWAKLSDNDVEKIALAWPQLEVFVLGTFKPWQSPSVITSKGFLSMLRHCRRLRELGLVIDATDVGPVTNEGRGTHVVNANVTYFDVGCSDIRDAASVAALLSAVTPRLAKIETAGMWDPAMMSRKTAWEQVRRLLRLDMPAG
ncbi:hypothetical protein BV22DRAFT_1037812 [Leucogyrophana mollusca]|uniref:Uncharacterized protein n=1 Tax=Leucogyrophana mollusca TaxID=85980 RepID=A0ACB8BA60_9AGAM|nr:hypothetical protein BV22DRAFT_1037812 [Leucogyrophana mollusca]